MQVLKGSVNWDLMQVASFVDRKTKGQDRGLNMPADVWNIVKRYYESNLCYDAVPAADLMRMYQSGTKEFVDAMLDIPGFCLAGQATVPSVPIDSIFSLQFFYNSKTIGEAQDMFDMISNKISSDDEKVNRVKRFVASNNLWVRPEYVTENVVIYRSFNCVNISQDGLAVIPGDGGGLCFDLIFRTDYANAPYRKCIEFLELDYLQCMFEKHPDTGVLRRIRTKVAVMAHKTRTIACFSMRRFGITHLKQIQEDMERSGFMLPPKLASIVQLDFNFHPYINRHFEKYVGEIDREEQTTLLGAHSVPDNICPSTLVECHHNTTCAIEYLNKIKEIGRIVEESECPEIYKEWWIMLFVFSYTHGWEPKFELDLKRFQDATSADFFYAAPMYDLHSFISHYRRKNYDNYKNSK